MGSDKERRVAAAYATGKSVRDIAREFGIGSKRLSKILKDNGVTPRPPGLPKGKVNNPTGKRKDGTAPYNPDQSARLADIRARRKENTNNRNKEILLRSFMGVSAETLAGEYGVTKYHINRIIKRLQEQVSD